MIAGLDHVRAFNVVTGVLMFFTAFAGVAHALD
jgi:hypothetical protein